MKKKKNREFRKKESPSEGGGLPFDEGGHRGGERQPQGLLFKSLFGNQKGRRIQARYQSKWPESLHKKEDVQDGHIKRRVADPSLGRLGFDHRSKGRLPT